MSSAELPILLTFCIGTPFTLKPSVLYPPFLRYILHDYLEIELENEDYKINIIDKNIVMFDINKTNSISIIENGGYKIIS